MSFSKKTPKRHIKHLNIVPILDMLTTVIFFLLLSTSFMEYTKITVPPSMTSVVTVSTPQPPAISPKLLGVNRQGKLQIVLTWTGKTPGQAMESVTLDDPKERRKQILELTTKLIAKFSENYPKEKTIQIGLGQDVPYQDLISLMDGTREKLPDVVLISYNEAEARTNGIGPGKASATQ